MALPLANTITPLISANFFYLYVINAVIGIAEGTMLKRWFAGGPRSVWWMIGANYLSAWVGWYVLNWLMEPRVNWILGSKPIERINLLAGIMALIAFAVTIIFEVGFVHLARQRV